MIGGFLYWALFRCSSTSLGVTQITCWPFQYFTILSDCSVLMMSLCVMLVIWLVGGGEGQRGRIWASESERSITSCDSKDETTAGGLMMQLVIGHCVCVSTWGLWWTAFPWSPSGSPAGPRTSNFCSLASRGQTEASPENPRHSPASTAHNLHTAATRQMTKVMIHWYPTTISTSQRVFT